MEKYEPSEMHLRHCLLFFYYWKKTPAESHRLLIDAYGDRALSRETCESWFERFQSGDVDLTDKERRGPPKELEDNLQALSLEDASHTQQH